MALLGSAASSVNEQLTTTYRVRYEAYTDAGGHLAATYDMSTADGLVSRSAMDVPSPWGLDVDVTGFTASVTASITPDFPTNPHGSGTITCRVLIDGRVAKENSASGDLASITCTATSTELETARTDGPVAAPAPVAVPPAPPPVLPAPPPVPSPVVPAPDPAPDSAPAPVPAETVVVPGPSQPNLESLCSDPSWRAANGDSGDAQCGTDWDGSQSEGSQSEGSQSEGSQSEGYQSDGSQSGGAEYDPNPYDHYQPGIDPRAESPGTLGGYAPTSGEIQRQHACETGALPPEQC